MDQGLLPAALLYSSSAPPWRGTMHFVVGSFCIKPEPKIQSYLTSLPTEILLEIAAHMYDRHAHAGHVVKASNLAAFSRASRRLRTVALPIMHREVILTSERQLRSFHRMPKELVKCVRELNIFMDVEFLEAWRAHAFSDSHYHKDRESLYEVLLGLLSRMSRITILRMRVAEISGVRSGWGKFAMSHRNNGCYGIPVGRAMGEAMRTTGISLIPSLQSLEMDGFQDIELLVGLAPNLESLTMCMSGGFAPYVNAELVWALQGSPRLRRLIYTPTSLDLDANVLYSDVPSAGKREKPGSALGLLEAIGRLAPRLEVLDLQTRAFDESIEFRSRIHLILPDELSASLRRFHNLKELRLPSTVLSLEESASIRTPYTTFSARRSAMNECTETEARAVRALKGSYPALESVTFVRPANPSEWKHHAVTYGTHTAPLADAKPIISTAADGQFAPWPFTPPVPLRVALCKWWSAPSDARTDIALSYLTDLDHVAGALRAMETNGVVQVGRQMYDCVEKTRLMVLMMANGALYVGRRMVSG